MNAAHSFPRVVSWLDTPQEALNLAAECVASGGILLYPTATIYGIGGDAGREDVAARIGELKGRDRYKPMLLLTDEWDRIAEWVTRVGDSHRFLMQHPRCAYLTILFEASGAAPLRLRGDSPLLGVRRTGHPFCRALIQQSGAPLISTSANRSGEQAARTVHEIPEEIRTGVDLLVDAGPSPSNVPSTVVGVTDGHIRIVREGAVKFAELSPGGNLAG